MNYPKTLSGKLHCLGVAPSDCRKYARLARSLQKTFGLTEMQAISLARLTYSAKEGFSWNIAGLAAGLETWTKAEMLKTESESAK